MANYSRPYHKSARLRHFAAGIGGALVLSSLVAASVVRVPSAGDREELSVAIDVRDVPCNEPYDDQVEVIPDTLSGRNRITVVVRNRDCCCCGEGERGTLGYINDGRAEPQRRPTPGATPQATPRDSSDVGSVSVVTPPAVTPPINGIPPRGPAAGPTLPLAAAPAPAVDTARRRVPWWLALAALPLAALAGGDGEPCEGDEYGRNSGPARSC